LLQRIGDAELTDRIIAQGKALICAIEALGTIEPAGLLERALAGLLQAAYKRWLRAIVAELPAWVMEEILSASRGIGERRAVLWMSENWGAGLGTCPTGLNCRTPTKNPRTATEAPRGSGGGSSVKSKLLTWLTHVLVLENIIALTGIVIAARLAVLDIKKGAPEETLNAIVALLTALAMSQIVTRYKSAIASDSISRMEGLIHRLSFLSSPPLRLRTELASLGESARNARNILIVAFSGAEVLRQTDFFADRLFQGATVRIAIADPENDALVEAMSPLTGIPREGFVADVQVAMGLIQVIRKQTSNTGRLQVRMFDYAPTLSLVMVDGDRPTGHIVVELRPYQVSSSSRPHLFLTARDNRVWYDYFRDVGESIWRDAKPVSESSLANQ